MLGVLTHVLPQMTLDSCVNTCLFGLCAILKSPPGSLPASVTVRCQWHCLDSLRIFCDRLLHLLIYLANQPFVPAMLKCAVELLKQFDASIKLCLRCRNAHCMGDCDNESSLGSYEGTDHDDYEGEEVDDDDDGDQPGGDDDDAA